MGETRLRTHELDRETAFATAIAPDAVAPASNSPGKDANAVAKSFTSVAKMALLVHRPTAASE